MHVDSVSWELQKGTMGMVFSALMMMGVRLGKPEDWDQLLGAGIIWIIISQFERLSPPYLASGLGRLEESRTVDQSTCTCVWPSVQHGGLSIVKTSLSVNVKEEKVALFCFSIKPHTLCRSHLLHFVGYKCVHMHTQIDFTSCWEGGKF